MESDLERFVGINRREFMAGSVGAIAAGMACGAGVTGGGDWEIRTLTNGPRHHFFGYYGICPWNRSGRGLVCVESGFQDRMPKAGEAGVIGLVDAVTGRYEKIAVGAVRRHAELYGGVEYGRIDGKWGRWFTFTAVGEQ